MSEYTHTDARGLLVPDETTDEKREAIGEELARRLRRRRDRIDADPDPTEDDEDEQ